MAKYTLRELVEVAKSPNKRDRNLLAESLSRLVLSTGRKLSETEQNIVYDILRHLIHQVEMNVRRALAESLAERTDAPHDILMALANDVIEVAHPVLTKSPLLQDVDLIRLILEHTQQHQIAIAKRAHVSGDVSETLVDTNDPAVINSLLQNENAELNEDTFNKLVESSYLMDEIRGPLAYRADLPPDLAKRMIGWVGAALRDYLSSKLGGMDAIADDMDRAIEHAVEDESLTSEMVGLASANGSADPSSGYRPHPRVLVRALEDGDILRFEALFREFTRLGDNTFAKILYDSGPEALAIACKASGIDRYSFSDILCHLHGAGDVTRYRDSEDYLKIMEYFERIGVSGAERVLDAWRSAETSAL
ncbi:DUF2336 domain-containing protein [Hwanghaeella grinnelliae]|uniref:DUF2336 domain-containing protein n=1 Tax=Hwanghaeella grinnelliae TaxID=2500179 RepID=A0A3S2WT81_9PROT|nr:DUF2336 domain-containing protein [Hwanghaeella grinnelliae]RVU37937.1 DUF2336 domain-containing protein [Hwanghaeella grinnelliae]